MCKGGETIFGEEKGWGIIFGQDERRGSISWRTILEIHYPREHILLLHHPLGSDKQKIGPQTSDP
jgi:hypothetical protein